MKILSEKFYEKTYTTLYILLARHLFEHLDGGKFKWTAPKGPLGTQVKSLNDNLIPIWSFRPVPTLVPQVDSKIFSEASNRERLHELLISISLGDAHVRDIFVTNAYPVISCLR